MRKKIESTYEEAIRDKKRKANIDREYKELLLSEMLIAAMEQDEASVRELAKAAGVSPTIIQELKTGKRKNITMETFSKVLHAIGYEVTIRPIK
jgi:DNA-binding Xre family transcriptional regulator